MATLQEVFQKNLSKKVSKEEIEKIIFEIKDESILKNIIVDGDCCKNLFFMAIVDVENQDKIFGFGSAKTFKKTENGFNVLTKDRLKLRERIVRVLSVYCGANINEEAAIKITKRKIDMVANNLVWVVPNEYCKDLCEENGNIYSSDGLAFSLEDIVGHFLHCYSEDFVLAGGGTNDAGLYFEIK